MTAENEEASGLHSRIERLLRHIPRTEWGPLAYPVIRALNQSAQMPLDEKELEDAIAYAETRENGRNYVEFARARKRIAPIWLSDLMKLKTKKVEWLIENLLPVGAIGVLSGDPASFKTWTLLHIASCVANGTPVFGNFKTRQGKVLIVDEENQVELLKERMEKLGATNGEVCFSSQFGFKVDREEDMSALRDFVGQNDIRLVMMDSLVRVNSKDENVAREIADLFEPLKGLARDGVSVLLTHHHRKQPIGARGSSSQNLRGSSDILASIDTHLAITHRKADRRLVIDQNKSRYAKELNPFEITIVEGPDGSIALEYEGEIEKEPLSKDQAKEGILSLLALDTSTRAQIEKDLPLVGRGAIATALKELVTEGTIQYRNEARGKRVYFLSGSDPQLELPI